MKIFPDKQLTVKETWLASLRLCSKTFTRVWPQSAMLGLTMIVMTWINTRIVPPSAINAQIKIQEMTLTKGIYIFASLAALFLMIYLGGVILHRTYVIGKEQKTSTGDSFAFVWKRSFTLISCLLLVFLSCMLGVLALIVPGIFLFILFTMVQPLILFDERGCFAALKHSCKLVWGNWWRTFAVFFPLLISSYAASFGAQFISNHGYWWYGTVGSAVFVIFFYPLFYACVLIQYSDLKLRRHIKRHDKSI